MIHNLFWDFLKKGMILGPSPMQIDKKFAKPDENLPSFLEAMHEGVWDWNIESNFVSFSGSWCQSLGYHPDEVVNDLSFYERLIHPEDLPHVQQLRQEHLEGHSPIFECENRIVMKSGDWRWNLDRGKIVARDSHGNPTRMLVVGVDISDKKQSEERETLQRRILEKIVKGDSLVKLFHDLCIHVEQIVPSSVCTAMLLDKNSGTLNIVAAPQALESASAILNGTIPGEASGACGTAMYTGKPVIITDTETDPRWDKIREVARPLGIKSCWSIPIFSEQEQPIGTFAISHTRIRKPSKFELQLLETASYLAGVAVQCIQGKQELKNSEDRYRESYKRTRDLTTRLEAAEESERRRLARELHDEFGQMLTGLKFDTAWLSRHLAKEKGVGSLSPYLNKLKGMSNLLDQTIQSVRRIATSLRPTILDDLGLIPALEWQAQEFQGRTGVQCQVNTAADMRNTILEGERATALFRIVQELLTNVMRHADASRVNLDLRQKDNLVILMIKDNGRGISEREIGHGTSLGLLGIKERIAPFGGKFQIHGEPGRGTQATVRIPVS